MASLEIQISADANDGYSTASAFSATAYNILWMGNSLQRSFMRFVNVTIPAGSTITAAKVSMRAYENRSSTTVNLNCHFEAADNPSAPTSRTDNDGRPLTSAVAWNGVASWTGGSWYDTPSLVSILQEVIDRPGWSSGNAITLHVTDNSSSAAAVRTASSYYHSSSYAAKLIVSYITELEGDLSDGCGASDSIDSFSLTDTVSDSAGAGDAIDAYNSHEGLAEEAGIGDAAISEVDLSVSLSDGSGLGDSADAGFESLGDCVDGSGFGGSSDAINWSAWLSSNRDLAVVRYHCTLTGAADSTTDIELPISSFQARKRTDESNYLSVVVPGYAYAEAIAARPNGDLFIEMAYEIAGIEVLREEIIRVDLEQINPQRGPRSRSITLIGHRLVEYDPRAASIAGCNYTYTYDGSRGYRFPQVDPYLNPGDSLTVEDTGDALTVDYITYAIAAKGAKFMEVRE